MYDGVTLWSALVGYKQNLENNALIYGKQVKIKRNRRNVIVLCCKRDETSRSILESKRDKIP